MIRTLRWNVDTGFNRMYWGMEEKGVRQPGRPKPQPGANEPGGLQVLPGTYKMTITYAGDTDSTFITVKDDPRLGNKNDIKIAQRKLYDRIEESSMKLTEGLDRLDEAEDVCEKIQAQLKGLEGKETDSLKKQTGKIVKDIKELKESITGKTDSRQGIVRNLFEVTALSQIGLARRNIFSKMIKPGPQEERLVVNAEKAVAEAIKNINEFFDDKWKSYRQLSENTRVNLFKDYTPIQ